MEPFAPAIPATARPDPPLNPDAPRHIPPAANTPRPNWHRVSYAKNNTSPPADILHVVTNPTAPLAVVRLLSHRNRSQSSSCILRHPTLPSPRRNPLPPWQLFNLDTFKSFRCQTRNTFIISNPSLTKTFFSFLQIPFNDFPIFIIYS